MLDEPNARGWHPHAAPPDPTRVLRRGRGGLLSAMPPADVPLMRVGAEPALLEELLGTIRGIAAAGAFTLGEHVEAFEDELAAYCGTGYAVGVSSGTEALALALRALRIGPGDEVVVPANSFIATAEAVSSVGAHPVLVDVDEQTQLITAELLAAAIGPRTRCVIPVHLYGAVVDMDALTAVARRAGIAVVEDACQAHGARHRGRRAGSIGDLGCFSFYPTKNLGAWGDGGAVVTGDRELAARVRMLRSHGERTRYRHEVIGTTARLDAIQAAVLRVKLRGLDAVNDERRRLGRTLREALAGAPVRLQAPAFAHADHVHHLLVVRTRDRDDLRRHLRAAGIATAVHYPVPIHRTEAYAALGLGPGSLPVSEALAAQSCTLPLFPGMTGAEADRVVAAVREWPDAAARPRAES